MNGKVLQWERSDSLPGDREFLWHVVSNTEHLNRSIGLPAVDFSSAITDETGLYRLAKARKGPLTLKWKEYPFEWVRPESYSVYREFLQGPFLWVRGGVRLKSKSDSLTEVTVFAEALPRGLGGRVAGRFGIVDGLRKTLNYLRAAIALRGGTGLDAVPRLLTRSATRENLLSERMSRLFRGNKRIYEAMRVLLLEGTDEEVLAIQPLLLAAKLGEDPDEVAKALLFMVRDSILSLNWKVLCPNCRVPKASAATLQEVPDQIHCDLCGVGYGTGAAAAIEMRFQVHPSIRQAVDRTYCIGGPAGTPHIHAQLHLKPDESKTVQLPGPARGLRIRTIRSNESSNLPSGATEVHAVFDGNSWYSSNHESTATLLKFQLQNQSDRPILAVLEDRELKRNVYTLERTLALQEFRDMFSRELLAPGLSVSIETASFLFTDLKDSTAMYEHTGDASAYVAVRDHFDLLKKIISENAGAIVKTIGDAVMAVFVREEDCLRAAMEICAEAKEFQRLIGSDSGKVIKVGIHPGQAIMVTANDRMDYFGSTVNTAARVQGLSTGGDCVMTEPFLRSPGCEAVMRRYRYEQETFEARLKGIKELRKVVRVSGVSRTSSAVARTGD